MKACWLAILATALTSACGGATNAEPEPAPPTSCEQTPRWTASGFGYGVRRGYLGFSPDGARLAWSSGQIDAVLREFDSGSGSELARVDDTMSEVPRNELVDRDGAWQRDLVGTYALYVAGTAATDDDGLLLDPFYQSQAASGCAFFDEGASRVFRPMCDAAGPLWQVLSADDADLLTSFGLPGECGGMTASQRDGDILLALDDDVAYWPDSADAPIATATHAHEAHQLGWRGLVGVALDPAQQRAISVAADGSVQLYRLPELTPEASALSAHVTVANQNLYATQVVVSPVSYSRDGSLLVLAGSAGALEVRRADNLQVLAELPESDVIALAFAPDDSQLAVASAARLAIYDCR